MELQERIQNKIKQIEKMEKNLVKYIVSDEFTAMCDRYFETNDFSELRQYKKDHNMWYLPDYYSKRCELEDAKKTLARYYKQQEIEELSEVVVEFQKDLIRRWDAYDLWKQQEIRKERELILKLTNEEEKRKARENLIRRWGRGYYDFIHLSEKEIHDVNVKNAENLVLDMIERTIAYTGKITNCDWLELNRDNTGYTIINGIVIGEKGKAKIESIGAGGYNIQRYHIRVLVKEVK